MSFLNDNKSNMTINKDVNVNDDEDDIDDESSLSTSDEEENVV